MKLLRQKSTTRFRDKHSQDPYIDLYLCWVYEGRNRLVRIRPQFGSDYSKLVACAEEVPSGEVIEKYL